MPSAIHRKEGCTRRIRVNENFRVSDVINYIYCCFKWYLSQKWRKGVCQERCVSPTMQMRLFGHFPCLHGCFVSRNYFITPSSISSYFNVDRTRVGAQMLRRPPPPACS